MSDDNLSQNQPNPSRDLSGFCVLNHFSSNYREASCYSLHLFNPPERKKEPNSHFPQGLSTLSIIQKFLQLTKAMNRRAVSVSSSLFTWVRQTLKIASTYCTVLSSLGRGYRRESGDGGSLPHCAFSSAVKYARAHDGQAALDWLRCLLKLQFSVTGKAFAPYWPCTFLLESTLVT